VGVVNELLQKPRLALDSETFGLGWTDKMFSLIIGDDKEQYYFNWYALEDHLGHTPPPKAVLGIEALELLSPLFLDKSTYWYMANAKYDMRRLDIEGINIQGEIQDVLVTERIIRNDHIGKYDLDSVAKWHGISKDDQVSDYIAKNKLYTMVQIPGKKTKVKDKYFEKVPFQVIVPYGCQDVSVTYTIGEEQRSDLGI
jgi:DNA polymerase I-like protein with 3'-5' exonuclease and polymerase domains